MDTKTPTPSTVPGNENPTNHFRNLRKWSNFLKYHALELCNITGGKMSISFNGHSWDKLALARSLGNGTLFATAAAIWAPKAPPASILLVQAVTFFSIPFFNQAPVFSSLLEKAALERKVRIHILASYPIASLIAIKMTGISLAIWPTLAIVGLPTMGLAVWLFFSSDIGLHGFLD